MRDRLRHVSLIDDVQSTDDPRHTRWEETRLDRWLVDWVLRRGKEETARKIAEEKGIQVRPLFVYYAPLFSQSITRRLLISSCSQKSSVSRMRCEDTVVQKHLHGVAKTRRHYAKSRYVLL